MDTVMRDIEKLLDRKILLLEELLETVEGEKEHMAANRADKIWEGTEKKGSISAEIQEIRKTMAGLLGCDGEPGTGLFDILSLVSSSGPGKPDAAIRKKAFQIRQLKKTIHASSRDSVRFVREYLAACEGLLETMLGASREDPPLYGSQARETTGSGSVYSREV